MRKTDERRSLSFIIETISVVVPEKNKKVCSLDYFSPYFLNVTSQCLKHQTHFILLRFIVLGTNI